MRSFSVRRRLLAAVGVTLALGVAASAAVAQTQPLGKLKGTIRADGSSTVGPYTTAAAELFRRAGAGKVNTTVGISGTGGGFTRFCNNETDIQNASRPMKLVEAQQCKTNDVGGWRAFTVANDALTVVVNPQNTWATCLTVEELKRIWEPGSRVDNWSQVRAGFPDQPLRLFGPGTDSGTFDYFTEVINGKSRASRSDYNASEDDNVLVQGVAGERGGLGYFGFSYFEENQSRLKALQVRNPKSGQCVSPSQQTVWNGTYKPLGRPLFIYVRASSFKRPEVQAFLRFMMANEVKIANAALFIPLTPAQLKKSRVTYRLALQAANRT